MPRCGETRPLTRHNVCAPCAALCGWDPPCDACKAEDSGIEPSGLRHVATCDGNRVQMDSARLLEIAGLSSDVSRAQQVLTRAIRNEAYDRGVAQGGRDVLHRLREQVRAAMGANVARERKATDDWRDGDALLNAARVDAFNWTLQRIDEELEKK